MSKSRSTHYKKGNATPSNEIGDENVKEIVETVSRETEFIPDGELKDETKVVDPKDPRHVDYKEEKGPQPNLSAKQPLTKYQELLQKQERQRKERTKEFNRQRALNAKKK